MGGELSTSSSQLLIEGRSLEVFEWKFADSHNIRDSRNTGGSRNIRDSRNTIVLIHEALGSASYWKSFPEQLARAACVNAVAYSRAGHGESEGPLEPRSVRYYQSQVETVLPQILRALSIEEPILYGHSEGAAIAFLYAAEGNPVKAIIAESPIVAPGENTLRTVEQMDAAEPRAELIEKLRRYHRNPEGVFSSWVEGIQLHLARQFPVASYLRRVQVPVLVLEGALDPFGGPAQRAILQAEIRNLHLTVLAQTGHLPHREKTQEVIEAVAHFLTEPLEPAGKALNEDVCDPPGPSSPGPPRSSNEIHPPSQTE
ncbi:MAG TPA: alpha/beta hydrolase [Acidobacteriaceae bacterium]